MGYKILVADDDGELWSDNFAAAIPDELGVRIEHALTPSGCTEKLRKSHYDLLLLDIKFDSRKDSGIDVLEQVRSKGYVLPVMMISSQADAHTVIRARKLGAIDFLVKTDPLKDIANRIINVLQRASECISANEAARQLADTVNAGYKSESMKQVFERVLAARKHSRLDCLILGEPGVGKEVVAKAISHRVPAKPFVVVHCGAIPENLIESELFGHVKGAFTGASSSKKGYFELAQGGDVFLDEVGTLSTQAQISLLRVLENREFTPVGGHVRKSLDVRVIAATNDDLDVMMHEGKFRKDLLTRLQGFEIKIPPLRQRKEDIPEIVTKLLKSSPKPDVKIDQTVMEVLSSYDWPGNIRELRNTLNASIAMVQGNTVTIEHLPLKLINAFHDSLNEIQPKSQGHLIHVAIPTDSTLEEAQNIFLRYFLTHKYKLMGRRPSIAALAKSLGVSRATIFRRLQDIGIRVGKGEVRINAK